MNAPSPPGISAAPDGSIVIDGALTFSTVTGALAAIGPRLAGEHIRINLSKVTHADSAGLALLIECVKQARRQGSEIRFESLPAQLAALAAACGLTGLLVAPAPDRGTGP